MTEIRIEDLPELFEFIAKVFVEKKDELCAMDANMGVSPGIPAARSKPRPEKESYRRSRQNRHWPKKQPKGSNTRRRIRQNDPTVRNRFEAAICDLEFEITKWDIQLE